jgi:hypothetical protein
MSRTEPDADVNQVVEAMAKSLVPDVCALVMEFLEDIHIAAGRREHQKKMEKLNEEYNDISGEGFFKDGATTIKGFTFNWRNLSIQYRYYYCYVYNLRLGGRYKLPDNYMYTRLYKNEDGA